MSETQLKEKIQNIETEVETLKRFLIKKPDFSVDEKNWNQIKADVKKVRSFTFAKVYGKK